MKKYNTSPIIFFIIAICYVIGNLIWWKFNTPILPHNQEALHFLDIFKQGFLFYSPPLLPLLIRLLISIFGYNYFDLMIILCNYIFFLITLYYIYKISIELKDKETGNIAMILFAMVPAIYGMSRFFGHQDYHIIPAITFNIYCLIKTNYFTNKKYSILYAVSIAFGLLIKDTFIIYFSIPFIYIITKSIILNKNDKKIQKTSIFNILLIVIISNLLFCWHYYRTDIINKIIFDSFKETKPLFDFESLRITTICLWEELLSPPIFIIFLFGLIWFVIKFKNQYKNIILLWIFIPWFYILLMPHYKLSEYEAGFIPAMILISAIFLSSYFKNPTRTIIISVIVSVGFLQFLDFSYGINTHLFNSQIYYKDNIIRYYNKKNCNIISYKNDSDIDKAIKYLTKYLKTHYNNHSIFVYQLENRMDIKGFRIFKFLCSLNINNFKTTMHLNYKNISSSDIIISFNPYSFVNLLVLNTKYNIKTIINYNQLGNIDMKEIKQEHQFLKEVYADFNGQFIILETLKIPNYYNKITILGKKDKFLK